GSTPTGDTVTTETLPAKPAEALDAPGEGQAIGKIEIPSLNLSAFVVEGVADGDLHRGPGHYPGTPLPGQAGNAAVAGHRTTYGAPFFRLDELAPGDPIVITTRQGQFTYYVQTTKAVSPGDVSVVDPTPDNRLTITQGTP